MYLGTVVAAVQGGMGVVCTRITMLGITELQFVVRVYELRGGSVWTGNHLHLLYQREMVCYWECCICEIW